MLISCIKIKGSPSQEVLSFLVGNVSFTWAYLRGEHLLARCHLLYIIEDGVEEIGGRRIFAALECRHYTRLQLIHVPVEMKSILLIGIDYCTKLIVVFP
jgi:hypothetical protein